MTSGRHQFAVRLSVVTLRIRDDRLCVLLARRVIPGGEVIWTLPGGHLGQAEDGRAEGLGKAAQRELERDAGLRPHPTYFAQLGTYVPSEAGEVLLAYLAVVAATASSQEEPGSAEWLQVDLVVDGSIRAEPWVQRVVRDGLTRAQGLLETTALGLAFCEEPFTIPLLRRVFETVWGLPRDTLDPGSFHKRLRAVPGLVEEAGSEERSGPGRPASLYRVGPLVRQSGSAVLLERPFERPWPSATRDTLALGEPTERGATSPSLLPTPRVEVPSGMNELTWESLLREARNLLWEYGSARRLVPYGELAMRLRLHVRSPVFYEALDALCIEETHAGGPMVTALMYNQRTRMPGQRFFVLAGRLRRRVDDLSGFVEAERLLAFEWITAHPERARLAAERIAGNQLP